MRKRVLVVLALMVCLLAQMVPVFAAGGVDISSLPGPPEGSCLVDSTNFVEGASGVEFGKVIDNMVNCTYMCDSPYHVLAYSPSSNMFFYSVKEVTAIKNESGAVEREFLVQVDKSNSDFNYALQESAVLEVGDDLNFLNGTDTVLLFIKDGTSSIEFCCPVTKLSDYVYDRFAGLKESNGETASISVELIEKITSGGNITGARFRFNYDLPGYERGGFLNPEYARTLFVDTVDTIFKIDDQTGKGYYEFTISKLKNMTYNVEMRTDVGNRYTTTFIVDFVTLPQKYDGSYDSPKISVENLPEDGVMAPVTITLVSDIPVKFYWNGAEINSGFSLSEDVIVYDNGTYSYEGVSELGKVSGDSITISTLLSGSQAMSSADLVSADGNLVQTGTESSPNVVIIVLVCASLLAILSSVLINRKVGDKK